MDLLDAGTLFQPELRLAEGTADIAVRLDIAQPHILTLDKIADRAEDIGKTAILIQPLGDILRKSAQNDQKDQQHDDDDQNGAARKDIDDIENDRDHQKKDVQLIVSVTILHKICNFLEKFTHIYHLTYLI